MKAGVKQNFWKVTMPPVNMSDETMQNRCRSGATVINRRGEVKGRYSIVEDEVEREDFRIKKELDFGRK